MIGIERFLRQAPFHGTVNHEIDLISIDDARRAQRRYEPRVKFRGVGAFQFEEIHQISDHTVPVSGIGHRLDGANDRAHHPPNLRRVFANVGDCGTDAAEGQPKISSRIKQDFESLAHGADIVR